MGPQLNCQKSSRSQQADAQTQEAGIALSKQYPDTYRSLTASLQALLDTHLQL